MFLDFQPPEGLPPKGFFEQWLIEAYNNSPDKAELNKILDHAIQFNISGDQGGVWGVSLKQGYLEVCRGEPAGGADLVMNISDDEWFGLNNGGIIMPMEFADPKHFIQEIRKFSQQDASFLIQMDGPGGGYWGLEISQGKFNVSRSRIDDPDISVRISVEDWRKMMSGGIAGPEEYMNPGNALRFVESVSGIEQTRILLNIEGENGGLWAIRINNGKLHVSRNPVNDPDILIQLPVSDWEAMMSGDVAAPGDFKDPISGINLLESVTGIEQAGLQIELEGDRGGFWSVRINNGKLHVSRNPINDPDIFIQLPVSDWEAMISGDVAAPADFKNPLNGINLLESVSGIAHATLLLELEGEKGGLWAIRINNGKIHVNRKPIDDPDIFIQLSVSDWEQMMSGESFAPEGFRDPLDVIQFVASAAEIENASLDLELKGESGGFWSMAITNGKLHVHRKGIENPDIKIKMSVEDWEGIMAGEAVAPEDFMDPLHVLQFVADFEDIDASLELELQGNDGGFWCLTLSDGKLLVHRDGLEDPDIKVVMPTDIWHGINTGDISAPQAFLEGRMRMAGDLTLAMQFATVFPGALGGDFLDGLM